MNLRTERACSLSSTHKIVFFGRMSSKNLLSKELCSAGTHRMCASGGLGENGESRVRDGCDARGTRACLQSPWLRGQQVFVQQQRASKRVRSEFSCQSKGRQLRYLDGNACTEYEDESHV